jgi:two-component system response regulator AtoC
VSRVLVVDDEPGMRAALDAHFLRRGWQVDTATGVRQAISKFAGVHHPLVITDIRMGDGDGFEVMRRVRAMAPRTAVILFTAFASVPQAVAAMKDGACDYLVKPVSFEQLDLAAARVLKAASLQPPDGPTLIGSSAP